MQKTFLSYSLFTFIVMSRQTTDALRRNKANVGIGARLTSRMLELRKSCSTTTPLTPETTATAMHTALEAVIEQLRPDIPSLSLEQPMRELKHTLEPYVDFLRVKAMRFFSLGSYPFQWTACIVNTTLWIALLCCKIMHVRNIIYRHCTTNMLVKKLQA